MSIADRRQRERQALREEILSAARDLFAGEGYESVSMRKIADRIEYSPTTIYLYFKDKDEIIQEICDQTFALLRRKLEKVDQTPGAPLERLKAGLKAYIEFGLKHPVHYRVALMMPLTNKHHRDFEESEGARSFQILTRSVAACVEAGLFRQTDVAAISQVLWTAIHGVTSLLITQGPCFPWIDQHRLVEMAIDASVGGFLR